MSEYDCRRLLKTIPSESVTALFLSKRDATSREVDEFHSLVNIDLFTRLRLITLLNIDGVSLCRFLRHARRCSLASLTLRSQFTDPKEKREVVEHLSSIPTQPTLVRLELLSPAVSMLMDQLEWSNQCKLRSQRIAWHLRVTSLSKLLNRLPDLDALVLNERLEGVRYLASHSTSFSSFFSFSEKYGSICIQEGVDRYWLI